MTTTNATTNAEKTSFVIIDGNVLGLINSDHPEIVHILHASILRGSNRHRDGWMFRPMNDKDMRPATRQDFDDYRVSTDWYLRHPAGYDFPTA